MGAQAAAARCAGGLSRWARVRESPHLGAAAAPRQGEAALAGQPNSSLPNRVGHAPLTNVLQLISRRRK